MECGEWCHREGSILHGHSNVVAGDGSHSPFVVDAYVIHGLRSERIVGDGLSRCRIDECRGPNAVVGRGAFDDVGLESDEADIATPRDGVK